MERLEIIYLLIEQMDKRLDQASAKEKIEIQAKIDFAFTLVDKIKTANNE